MRVLIADKLEDRARVRLASRGHEVRMEPGLAGDALVEALAAWRPEALVVRSTKVTRPMLELGCLSLVVRAGAGVNTIDLKAAGEFGVFVSNCPGKNADAVAELTMGLLVAVDRHIAAGDRDLKEGRWNKGAYSKASGLAGRTLGILGMGDIGQGVAKRARAFGMDVIAWSRSLTPDRAAALGVRYASDPSEVAAAADVLSVHLALTDATRGFVGPGLLGALKHGSIFLNTSRAEVVDEAALLEALETRSLRAGLDVFSGEPSGKDGAFTHPLAAHPRVTGTHHTGASTDQAQEAVADEAVRIVEVFGDTGRAPNCVNLTGADSSHVLVVRHRDRVGVLAAVLDVLRGADLNVGELENTRFTRGGASSARIGLDAAPSPETLERIGALPDVLHTSVAEVATVESR
ncbi:MAG: hydroxyacid dehydrogenase [Alphaproteobacteria bacterium]|nr:hydroxyacid dehydrogenase [Alphaproteobacteria bacterium]